MALGGAIEPPDQYLFYFTTKFPYLLMHTYIALSNFHDDFSEYYQCESHGFVYIFFVMLLFTNMFSSYYSKQTFCLTII